MKKTNLSWVGALLVFALLLWCTAATPGKIDDPSTYTCAVYSSALSLLPPVVAIVLALNTKEVYTSLLVGIATGALLYANGNLELALTTLFFNEDGGMVSKLSDSSNVGILVFLVMLGILVALMNKAGGSAAFGRWASTHIHTRAGAQFATLLLGILIFVDDYFNCLTVGSVMRPVTDRQKVSRAKLAYLIDATAAPVCIIAPVSSWAAAVTSSVPEGSGINGFTMFLRTIPYNYYAILTMVMSLFLIFSGLDYGPMKKHEDNALLGDLFTTDDRPYGDDADDGSDTRGRVVDLIAPVLVLIAACIFGMVYTGGFFEGVDFVTAFANCSASMGLVLGSAMAMFVAKDGTVTEVRPMVFDRIDRFTMCQNCRIPIQTVLFRRSLFERYGGLIETLEAHEDWGMWLKYLEHGRRITPHAPDVRRATSLFVQPAAQSDAAARMEAYRKSDADFYSDASLCFNVTLADMRRYYDDMIADMRCLEARGELHEFLEQQAKRGE